MTDRRLATGHHSPDDGTGLVLWQVTNRWQAAQRAALRPLGLTNVQFVLLASLAWLDGAGPVTQRHLAEHAGTDAMMTSQLLRTLELRGLVARVPHPSDRRARAVSGTAKGRALADEAIVVVKGCDAAFFAALGSEIGALTGLLRRLRDAHARESRPD